LWGVITKLSKGDTVSMEVLIKICRHLGCDPGDIMELTSDEDKGQKV
jgi:DNA-binding Xre family transcriptional regulator